MDDDKKIQDVLRLERENNMMLKKLLAIHHRSLIYRIIYWIIIIGITIGLFSFLRPSIDRVMKFLGATPQETSTLIDSIR